MKTNGLNINAAAIAAGIYDIILAEGDEHIVAFGMLPQKIMGPLEQQLRSKIKDICYAQHGITESDISELKKYITIDEQKLNSLVAEIMREISSEILKVAAAKGIMRV